MQTLWDSFPESSQRKLEAIDAGPPFNTAYVACLVVDGGDLLELAGQTWDSTAIPCIDDWASLLGAWIDAAVEPGKRKRALFSK